MGQKKWTPYDRKVHLAASENITLCGRWRTGNIETLVGPPREQLRQFLCKYCMKDYRGAIAPDLKPGRFSTESKL